MSVILPNRSAKSTVTAFSLAVVCSTHAAIIAPTSNWEADLDPTPGNNLWESSVNPATTTPWTFPAGRTPTNVSAATAGTNFSAIGSAYSFPRYAAIRADWNEGVPGGAGAASSDATFELVFRLNNDTGAHVLFETGGANMGTSITISGTTLTFRSQQGGAVGQFATVDLEDLSIGTFHQIVATIDMDDTTPDVIREIQLFHNGALVDTDGPPTMELTTVGTAPTMPGWAALQAPSLPEAILTSTAISPSCATTGTMFLTSPTHNKISPLFRSRPLQFSLPSVLWSSSAVAADRKRTRPLLLFKSSPP